MLAIITNIKTLIIRHHLQITYKQARVLANLSDRTPRETDWWTIGNR